MAPVCLIHFPRMRHSLPPTSPNFTPSQSLLFFQHAKKRRPAFYKGWGENRKNKSFQQDVKSHPHFTFSQFKKVETFSHVIFDVPIIHLDFVTWVEKNKKTNTYVFSFKAFMFFLKNICQTQKLLELRKYLQLRL